MTYVLIGLVVTFVLAHILYRYLVRKRMNMKLVEDDRSLYAWETWMIGVQAVSASVGIIVFIGLLARFASDETEPKWLIDNFVAGADFYTPTVVAGRVHEVLPIPGTSLAYAMVVSDSMADHPVAYPVLVSRTEAPEVGEQVMVRRITSRNYRHIDSVTAERSPPAPFADPIRVLLTPANSMP